MGECYWKAWDSSGLAYVIMPSGLNETTMELLGEAVWQTSLHIPRGLEPFPPPPLYTLYAFNIELPPILIPPVTSAATGFLLEDSQEAEISKSSTKRRRTSSQPLKHNRKRRLLSFTGGSPKTSCRTIRI
jgi:hypothetical protein